MSDMWAYRLAVLEFYEKTLTKVCLVLQDLCATLRYKRNPPPLSRRFPRLYWSLLQDPFHQSDRAMGLEVSGS